MGFKFNKGQDTWRKYLMGIKFIEILTLIVSLWDVSGYSAFRMLLLVYWYQKKALIGFFGASTSLFFLVFFSGFSSFPVVLPLAIFKSMRNCYFHVFLKWYKIFEKLSSLKVRYYSKFHHFIEKPNTKFFRTFSYLLMEF